LFAREKKTVFFFSFFFFPVFQFGLNCIRAFFCALHYSFFVLFCVVGAVYKFDFRLVMNETPNNGDQWKERHAVIENFVFDRISVCIPDRRRVC
jgi:hypothetical protein